MRRISITSFKGGVGKTTTAVNLAHGLTLAGKRTLLIDADGSANATIHLMGRNPAIPLTLYDLLCRNIPLNDVICYNVRTGLDMVVGSGKLWLIDGFLDGQANSNDVLVNRLKGVSGYDYVIVDCPPTGSRLNLNAISYASEVFIPVSGDFLSFAAVDDIVEAVKRIGKSKVTMIIPTIYDQRVSRSKEVLESLRRKFGGIVSPPIRVDTKLSEAPGYGKTIYEYALSTHGALDYLALTRKVISQASRIG
ncbi:MAG: ParA family protein [bacterium]